MSGTTFQRIRANRLAVEAQYAPTVVARDELKKLSRELHRKANDFDASKKKR